MRTQIIKDDDNDTIAIHYDKKSGQIYFEDESTMYFSQKTLGQLRKFAAALTEMADGLEKEK